MGLLQIIVMIFVFLFINSGLLLLSFTKFNAATFSDVMTPIVTAATGLLIFLTLRENRKLSEEAFKGNRISISKRLYEYYKDEIVIASNKKFFTEDTNPNFVSKIDDIRKNSLYHDLSLVIDSTPNTWIAEVKKLYEKILSDKIFDDLNLNIDGKKDMIKEIIESDSATYYEVIDNTISEFILYFKSIRNKLRKIIEDQDLMKFDRNKLIKILLNDTTAVQNNLISKTPHLLVS